MHSFLLVNVIPFIEDRLGCTVFHIWNASKMSLQWLSQQHELQLANLSVGEWQDMILTRLWTISSNDWTNQISMILNILPKNSNRFHICQLCPGLQIL